MANRGADVFPADNTMRSCGKEGGLPYVDGVLEFGSGFPWMSDGSAPDYLREHLDAGEFGLVRGY